MTTDHNKPQGSDTFDRIAGALIGVPDVKQTKTSSIMEALPIAGNVTTYTVQTLKLPERGYLAFLTVVSADQNYRIVLPGRVLGAIYRQRDALTDRSTPASRARAKAKRERLARQAAKQARRAGGRDAI